MSAFGTEPLIRALKPLAVDPPATEPADPLMELGDGPTTVVVASTSKFITKSCACNGCATIKRTEMHKRGFNMEFE